MTVLNAEVLVLGGGPGGYSAAFRAADLGKQVVLVEREPVLGGVCLNVGCIPSKALLHIALVIHEAEDIVEHGVSFTKPTLDLDKIRTWKESVTKTLNGGLSGLAKQRKVTVIHGTGQFISANSLAVQNEAGTTQIDFEQAIIAAGSQPTKIPAFPNDDPRLWDSTDALALTKIPNKLLIVGGGIIGLEMATVYHALGSQISVVELMDQIIPGCDKDLITPLFRRIKKQYQAIWLETRVTAIEAQADGLRVSFDRASSQLASGIHTIPGDRQTCSQQVSGIHTIPGDRQTCSQQVSGIHTIPGDKGKGAPESELFDAVLVAVGRRPNGKLIAAGQAGVTVDEQGFIPVDKQQRTNVPHIFAIGDIVGNPMLAHKAVHEGKVAAEVIAGHKAGFDALTIPSVAYTDPEIAWMGLTENQAKQQGIAYDKGVFPWAASGRSLSMGRKEGITKILCEKETGRMLGAGMVGPNAGELIAEAVLALEMGA
ncbi:MAG: NAD(P)/FAD-dependent oxidoreductase, partial [Methylovulum sp.]|nr:NAD(P)/FAD-dependent oxidoreductase [Methylovulum sp.]